MRLLRRMRLSSAVKLAVVMVMCVLGLTYFLNSRKPEAERVVS